MSRYCELDCEFITQSHYYLSQMSGSRAFLYLDTNFSFPQATLVEQSPALQQSRCTSTLREIPSVNQKYRSQVDNYDVVFLVVFKLEQRLAT